MAQQLICTICGHFGSPKKTFGIATRKNVCEKCGSEHLIPADTPVGKKILSEHQTQSVQSASERTSEKTKSTQYDLVDLLKWLGIAILLIVGLVLWYVSIPVLVIWYLYKKNKNFTATTKLAASIAVSVFFLAAGIFSYHANRAPTIIVIRPESGFSVQASTTPIRGNVEPKDATVTINGTPMSLDPEGNFTYDAVLGDEKNRFTIQAVRRDKTTEAFLTVNREFSAEEKAARARLKAEAEAAQKADAVAKVKEQLQRELDSFNKPFDTSNFRGSVVALQMEVVLFGAWTQLIAKYKEHADPGIRDMTRELERKASALQVKEFPLMRKEYADLIHKEMWEHNTEVRALGTGNKTIELVSAMFASNKNIAEAHRTLQDALKIFRFTQANYKWYKFDEEYSYFEIESVPDSKVQ